MSTRLHHRVRVEDAHAHLLSVETRVEGVEGASLVLVMAGWTPGSYLVREYARHVERFGASTLDGTSLPWTKLRKNAWRVETGGATTVVVRYAVYCNDLSVRTNHVDTTHAYFNGAATFLHPDGDTSVGGTVLVEKAEGARVSTALERDALGAAGAESFRFGSIDELIDSPFELGVHDVLELEAGGRAHSIAIWSPGHARSKRDDERLVRDVRTIVETEASLYGGLPEGPYLFILHLAAGGRGGLEHRASSSLLASPYGFETEKGYEDLLSLFAHEYLHRWHVKRARPSPLVPYDYEREAYTRQLWLFEGGTSYYDWHVLRRAGLVGPRRYLEHLADEILRLEDAPGRRLQSLEEASFDAWVKLYRPDENTFNSTISYYLKGEIVCALLDVVLRARSRGERSFDDVMRAVLARGGDGTAGLAEGAFDALVLEVTGVDVGDLTQRWIRGREDLDYAQAFAPVGLEPRFSRREGGAPGVLGIRVRAGSASAAIAGVARGSAAELAGLETGDEIVAVDGIRVDESRLTERLKTRAPGDRVELSFFRRERLLRTEVVLEPARADQLVLGPMPGAAESAVELRRQWLHGDLEVGP